MVSQDITATLCYRQAPTRTRLGESNAMTCRRRTSTRRLKLQLPRLTVKKRALTLQMAKTP